MTPDIDIAAHRQRNSAAWSIRQNWNWLYDQVFEYTMPYRGKMSAGTFDPREQIEKVFDQTSISATFAGAGRLQQELFPPGQPFFTFVMGPVLRRALDRAGKDPRELERELQDVAETVSAFFISGEFDQAALEMCIDLFAGFGGLLPLEGDDEQPVRFVNVPMQELALEPGPYGDVGGMFWRTRMSRRNVKASFPKGAFSQGFEARLKDNGDEDVTLCQDFTYDAAAKKWLFCAWILDDDAHAPMIATSWSRAKPMATPRYHRVPGEVYGRGPALLALPTTKTLNKAVELLLKSAAIQMLGIWGYRPNSAFNPDTIRLAPGAFWPMNSTGGVLGPDVQRLDPAAGRMDVAQLVTTELRMQLQAAMHDDKLPDKGATPVSATEVMARMQRVAQNYVGAFGRLVHEIIPVMVRRVMEILHRKRLIKTSLRIDQLLVQIQVNSPMAMALRMRSYEGVLQLIQIIASLKGPEGVQLLIKLDELLADMAKGMNINPNYLLTQDEKKQLEAQMAMQAVALAVAAESAKGGADAAPAEPQPEPVPE